jgi:hypothetical protein
MKKLRIVAMLLFCVSAACVYAQDTGKAPSSPKKDDPIPAVTPLRIQVVFTEFDGEKKVSSLPYTFTVNADERRTRPSSQVRNGARIPVSTDKDKFTYLDIGTNIDCSAMLQDDGRFKLTMNVERSSIAPESTGSPTSSPVLHQFRAETNPVLKDGQTVETIVSTDPLNGHVYRVAVTLNVVK